MSDDSVAAFREALAFVRSEALPWARPLRRRCRARVEPNPSGLHGRCDLAPHPPDVDHALDRGMDTPRWSTAWTA